MYISLFAFTLLFSTVYYAALHSEQSLPAQQFTQPQNFLTGYAVHPLQDNFSSTESVPSPSLINQGANVEQAHNGTAPDLGPFER
jgi:hypothetical protein